MTSPWRVAVTRDEGPDGPLSRALRLEGFDPRLCVVSVEEPAEDQLRLSDAANRLEQFDWVICASRRAVDALSYARGGRPWAPGVRTAAVGLATAEALQTAGAGVPVVAAEAGADALWDVLKDRDDWQGRRVLIPTVRGGRRTVVDGLTAAGAIVSVIEAYVMQPRPPAEIAATWAAIAPDCAIVLSPSVAARLTEAVGVAALLNLRAIVAMGATTAGALEQLGVAASVPATNDFAAVARHLATIKGRTGPV